jgi:hypothetical protein
MIVDWLNTLDNDQRRRAECMIRMLKAKGVEDPEDLAEADLENEEVAQVAGAVLLTKIWREAIDPLRDEPESWIQSQIEYSRKDREAPFADAGLALERLLQAGMVAKDVGIVARFVAFNTAQTILAFLDHIDFDPELSELEDAAQPGDVFPGWVLMETLDSAGPNGPSSVLSGREVAGLNMDMLGMDPSGKEGRP